MKSNSASTNNPFSLSGAASRSQILSVFPKPRSVKAQCVVFLWLAAYWAHGALTVTNLVSFNGTNGANPWAALAQGSDGKLYGIARNGGQGFSGPWTGSGTVFEMALNGAFSVLLTNAGLPGTPLLAGPDGKFYFCVSAPRYGAIYSVTTNGTPSIVYTFAGGSDGCYPKGITWGSDGKLYGTTSGATQLGNYGTIFSLTTNGTLTTLFTFGGANGYFPYAGLVQGTNGCFYGTTTGRALEGNYGGIFQYDPNGFFTNLSTSHGYSPYANPRSTLIQGSDGAFYGTTFEGGDLSQNYGYGDGTVFRITTDGSLSILVSFTGPTPAYSSLYPSAPLLQSSDGSFYGTTYSGGESNLGTVFQMTPDGRLTTLYSFTGGNDGAHPVGGLLQTGSDGNFYGTTLQGGANNLGCVFRFPLPLTFQRVTRTGNVLTFTWGTVTGRTYQIETAVDLVQGVWTNSGPAVTATSGTTTGSYTIGPDPQRFYRVVQVP
jgi:uncharacterized repeat protein (TIGR03803 family)